LSVNESKENINKMMSDFLNKSNLDIDKNDNLSNNFDTLREARDKFEKDYLSNQLKKNHGNISKTADLIGMERSALHRKLKSLGIKGIN
jgi:two-component system nitrogen regulation response regulator NtrX